MTFSLFLITFTQVVTESLPISSSSHLRLVGYLLSLSGVPMPVIVYSGQWELFEHLLHIPTVIVVSMVLLRSIGRESVLGADPESKELSPSSSSGGTVVAQKDASPVSRNVFPGLTRDPARILLPLTIATAVTVACYYIKKSVWYQQRMPFALPVWVGLAITGILLLATKWAKKNTPTAVPNWWQGGVIGLIQGIALGPGLSRLGVTYSTGVFLGIGNLPSLFFSFLMQLVLMSGAIVRALYHMKQYAATHHESALVGEGVSSGSRLLFASLFSWHTFVALVLGAIVAYRLLLLVVRLVRQNRLWPLSIYLFVLALIWRILNLP